MSQRLGLDNAFPSRYCDDTDTGGEDGMSMREWFAGQALAGLCHAHGSSVPGEETADAAKLAWKAFLIADAMLAEANK